MTSYAAACPSRIHLALSVQNRTVSESHGECVGGISIYVPRCFKKKIQTPQGTHFLLNYGSTRYEWCLFNECLS